jgi:hypothetical protein
MKHLAIGIAALVITTTATIAQAPCPQVGQPSKEFAITEGFPSDPKRHDVTAGGNIDLRECPGVPGSGWVTKLPDFVVNYTTTKGAPSAHALTFRIEASTDTVLLINSPDNKWHYDDDGGKGLNGKLRFPNAAPGRYDVWVGTYASGLQKAKLVITELE